MIPSSLTAAYVTELCGQELENRFTTQARRPAVRALFFVQQYPVPLIVNVRQFVRYLFIQRRRKHRRSIPPVFSIITYWEMCTSWNLRQTARTMAPNYNLLGNVH